MPSTKKFSRLQYATWAVAAVLMLAALPQRLLAQAPPGATTVQTSVERGVTVKLTPKAMGTPGSRWELSVVLDTHSGDLSDDLMQSASLTLDDGRVLKPLAWVGAGPGGHHREGVLVFEVPSPRPAAVELRIVRFGEPAPRTFRWRP